MAKGKKPRSKKDFQRVEEGLDFPNNYGKFGL